jgi:hypothetical protein
LPWLLSPLSRLLRIEIEIAVIVRGHNKLDLPGNRQINRLLIEGVSCHAKQKAQIIHLGVRQGHDVSTTDVLDGWSLRAFFVLARNHGIASVECFRPGVSRRENAADLVDEQVPCDWLVRFLVGITHNGDKELTLDPAFIHGSILPASTSSLCRLYHYLT